MAARSVDGHSAIGWVKDQYGLLVDSIDWLWVGIAAVSFVISLLSGVQYDASVRGRWAFFIFWAAGGLGSLYALYRAFEEMYVFLIWVCVSVAASYGGALSLIVLSDRAGFLYVLVGLGLLGASAFVVVAQIWARIKAVRDIHLQDNPELGGRPSSILDDYSIVPWSVALGGVWVLGLVSALLITTFVAEAKASREYLLQVYTFVQVFLFLFLIYVLWWPEQRLGKEADARPRSPPIAEAVLENTEKKPAGSKVRKAMAVARRRQVTSCPICNKKPTAQARRCPSCERDQIFYACETDERLVRRCSNCRAHVLVGDENCASCGTSIPQTYACPGCTEEFAPEEYQLLSDEDLT